MNNLARFTVEPAKFIPDELIEKMHAALTPEARASLRTERALTDEVIDRYKLGVQNGRLTIPIRDAEGNCVDIRRWLSPKERRDDEPKILHWAQGYGAPRLFPIDQLKHPSLPLVEGELDALTAISQGIPAITVTAGVQTWHDSLSELLEEKTITILMDHDEAGRKGAEKRAQSLAPHGCTVRVAKWPEDRPEGWDVTDELITKGVKSLRALLEAATPVTGPVVRLFDVQSQQVEWLWERYIPLGKVTLIEGDPGLGKSWLTLAIATAISLGRGIGEGSMSDSKPSRSLLLSAEDGLADTIKPRLEALGANCTNIFAVNEPLVLTEEGGFDQLESYVRQYQPRVVILDPLFAFTGSRMDIHRANEARAVMSRLASLADRHRCSIICVRHLTKSDNAKAAYRGIGSIDFYAACRSVLLVGKDPNEDSRRVIVHTKHNLSPQGDSLSFTLDEGQFAWTGKSDLSAEEILAPSTGPSKLAQAKEFLRGQLVNGPTPSEQILIEGKQAGFSEKTLRRAKDQLGMKSRRQGFGGGKWDWYLPDNCPEDRKMTILEDSHPDSEGGKGTELDHLREKDLPNRYKTNNIVEDGQASSQLDNLRGVATPLVTVDGQGGNLKEFGHLRSLESDESPDGHPEDGRERFEGMSLAELLSELASHGVLLGAKGERIQVDAPNGVITGELRKALKLHKEKLLRLIGLGEAFWPAACLWSEQRVARRYARLFPLLLKGVETPKGPGRLLQVFSDVARVHLKGEERSTAFDPGDIWPVQGGREGVVR